MDNYKNINQENPLTSNIQLRKDSTNSNIVLDSFPECRWEINRKVFAGEIREDKLSGVE